jgi:hypothetical protein
MVKSMAAINIFPINEDDEEFELLEVNTEYIIKEITLSVFNQLTQQVYSLPIDAVLLKPYIDGDTIYIPFITSNNSVSAINREFIILVANNIIKEKPMKYIGSVQNIRSSYYTQHLNVSNNGNNTFTIGIANPSMPIIMRDPTYHIFEL